MTEHPREGSHFQYDAVVERNVKIPARNTVYFSARYPSQIVLSVVG